MVEHIEKEAAQKIICGWCGVCKSPTVCDLMHCDDICPQFAQIPAADVRPKWISVEERLPEFDQKVLAWVKNKDPKGRFNPDGIYTAELKDKTPEPDPEGKRNFWGIPGYDSAWTVWSWSYFSEPDVLYWMPLPEPPKEE